MNYKGILRPWIQLNTWNDSGSCETEKFNKALHQILEKSEETFDCDKFQEAIRELLTELHPKQDIENTSVQDFAIKAEHINEYLRDTK